MRDSKCQKENWKRLISNRKAPAKHRPLPSEPYRVPSSSDHGVGGREFAHRQIRIEFRHRRADTCITPDHCIEGVGSRDADPQEIVETALRMQSTALLQRLGFLSDLVGWWLPDTQRARVRSAIAPSRRATFGRTQRRESDIGYVASWGLLVHAARSDLLADVPQTKPNGSH